MPRCQLRGSVTRSFAARRRARLATERAASIVPGSMRWPPRQVAKCGARVCWTTEFDVGLRHKHPDHPRSPALIDLQLKATTVAPSGGFARAKMTRKRALEMSEVDPTVSMVVAVLTMSAVQPHWTFTNQRSLVLFGRCYWVNLAGLVVPAGEPNDKVTVKAPVEQVLDDVALARMMERVGRR